MKPTIRIGLLVMVVALLAGPIWLQRQQTIALREAMGALRGQERELARLREENVRLTQGRISPAALENLRADHVAIVRLREQVERLKAGTRRRAQ